MRNFIYTTIASIVIIIALLSNIIRLNNEIENLNDCIQCTYTELQELRYELNERCPQGEINLENNLENDLLIKK